MSTKIDHPLTLQEAARELNVTRLELKGGLRVAGVEPKAGRSSNGRLALLLHPDEFEAIKKAFAGKKK